MRFFGQAKQTAGKGSQSIQVSGNGSTRIIQAGRDIRISDGSVTVDNRMYGPLDESGAPAWIQVNKDMLADAWNEGRDAMYRWHGNPVSDPPKNPYR